MNDQEVIERVLKGDLNSFSIIVDRYERLVFSIVSSLLKKQEDIEDVSQEAFIKVYRGLLGFNFNSKLSTWIAKIAYRSSLNHLKKFHRKSNALDEAIEEINPVMENPDSILEIKDSRSYIHKLINELREEYKTAVTLFHIHSFSYVEIETITGWPEGTVKTYLYRARKILKEQMITHLKSKPNGTTNR